MLLGSKERKSFMSWCGKIDNFLISGERARQEENSIQFCWVLGWMMNSWKFRCYFTEKCMCKDPRLMLVAESFIFREREENCDHHVMAAAQCLECERMTCRAKWISIYHRSCCGTENVNCERAAVVLRMRKFCVVISDGPMMLKIGWGGNLEFHWRNNMETL